jgi:hypothetical protein
MNRITKLLGREADIDEVGRSLYADAAEVRAAIVGGMLITCSDESERQGRNAFQRNFAEHLLPSLKPGERSFFRLANLGGRYETGAVEIARQHYLPDDDAKGYGLLVIKINSHVSAEDDGDGYRFGRMKRYGADSVYCGALHAMLDGSDLPFATDLAATFRTGGLDRLALLADEARVAPEHRSLFVAMTNASLQALRTVDDVAASRPTRPSLFVVVHGVILNKKQKDSEIICGIHRIDWRTDEPERTYNGLGDDPSRYRVRSAYAPLIIEDDTLSSEPTTAPPE